jgi:SAM domain (Sterile alpha motif)
MAAFGEWLAEIGLRSYDAVFASNKIDFDVIRSLSDTDLRELGLALGDRKRLLQAVAKLDEHHR